MAEFVRHLGLGMVGRQLWRYGIIGLLSNAAGYGAYLLITALGVPPKLAMSCLYVVGATVSFFCNGRITFAYRGTTLGAGLRYLAAHALGYSINLALLVVFVDRLGFAHQIVQGLAIFVVAAFLFAALKFFVFSQPAPRPSDAPP